MTLNKLSRSADLKRYRTEVLTDLLLFSDTRAVKKSGLHLAGRALPDEAKSLGALQPKAVEQSISWAKPDFYDSL
ncbi:hypothetical protein [Rhodopirellula europaea]|uniref:hypothetical protein n=1 Tax=Rhodopirellula europaea TaxID=1263866 RepID=UPI0003494DA5|nr:hypothetical protein [Rhodopirellula europaea]